ncbi:hypothetical protein D3C83_78210 [compost metagenome]
MPDAVVEHHHHAGDRADRRAEQEGERDDAVDIHAHQAGHFGILLGGAHGATHAARLDEP